MRILFLDDMRARHELFEQCAIGHVVHHAWTAREAIRFLERETYAAASLDHDLAEDHYQGQRIALTRGRGVCATGDDTGRSVARWIAEHETPRYVLVHSHNPVGAEAMVAILADAGIKVTWAPFGPDGCARWLESF